MKTTVFTFGRYQPPTKGHQLVFDTVKAHAESIGADHRIYASRSDSSILADDVTTTLSRPARITRAEQNPLNYDEKHKILTKVFPKHNFVNSPKVKTIFDAAYHASTEEGAEHLVFVGEHLKRVVVDRMQEYIGHKDFPNLKKVSFLKSGDRDPDAEGVVGVSGTKTRAAATEGDHDSFHDMMPDGVSRGDSREIMRTVRHSINRTKIAIEEFKTKKNPKKKKELAVESFKPFIFSKLRTQLNEERKDLIDKMDPIMFIHTDPAIPIYSCGDNRTNRKTHDEIAKDAIENHYNKKPSGNLSDQLLNLGPWTRIHTYQSLNSKKFEIESTSHDTLRHTLGRIEHHLAGQKVHLEVRDSNNPDPAHTWYKNVDTEQLRDYIKYGHQARSLRLESFEGFLQALVEEEDKTRMERDHRFYGWGDSTPSSRQLLNRKKKDKRTVARRKANASGRTHKGDASVDLDHKNGNANDNSPGNLRVISRHLNRSRNNNK